MDARLKKLQETLTEAISGLSGDELTWHPPDKWSATEVLEHLYLTYSGTIRGFEKIAEAGKPLATSEKLSWRALVVVGLGHFPEGRQSPQQVKPRGLPHEQVVSDIGPAIQRMDEAITRAEEAFGRRKKLLDHPILGPLTANQWRKFHLVHGLHHAKQLRRLRDGCRAGRA